MKKVNGILYKVTADDLKLLRTNPKEFWADVNSIGYGAFTALESLKEITIPASIKKIADDVFYGCKKLVKVSLNEGVEEIGTNVFGWCESLKEVEFPSTAKKIASPFFNCKKLKKVILHEGVEEIGRGAFWGCESLKEIEIPTTIKKIEGLTFAKCKGLKKILLPKELEEIGEKAFIGCDSLKEVVIPTTIKKIAFDAFPSHTKVIIDKKEKSNQNAIRNILNTNKAIKEEKSKNIDIKR